jgi:hypothetical protein
MHARLREPDKAFAVFDRLVAIGMKPVLTAYLALVVEYCLLTVWPVRGSFLPGDLALASPMSILLMTHLCIVINEYSAESMNTRAPVLRPTLPNSSTMVSDWCCSSGLCAL